MLRDTFFTRSETDSESHPTETSEMELPIDLFRAGDNLIARAPILGVDISRLNVTLGQSRLTIHKTATPPADTDKPDRIYYQECHWGELSRSVDLPLSVNLDTTRATLHDGILTIIMPIVNANHSKVIKIK